MTQHGPVVPRAVPKADRVLLTPEVEALLDQSTGANEMWGVVDAETIRRHVRNIPDQDPRHWDEELAKPRFGGTTTPPVLVSFISTRTPPEIPDDLHELMVADWFKDEGTSEAASHQRGLTRVGTVAATRSHFHTGDEVVLHRYPRVGDRIFSETKYSLIEEIRMRSGTTPALMSTTETRYWNQDDETIMIFRTTGMDY